MQHSTGSTRFAPIAAIALSIALLAFFLSDSASDGGVATARAEGSSGGVNDSRQRPSTAASSSSRSATAGDERADPVGVQAASIPAAAAPAPPTMREHLSLVFHTTLDRAELSEPDFAERRDSELERLSIVIRNGGYSAEELRALADELGTDDPLRTWAVLATAYGTEFTSDHTAWLERLALGEREGEDDAPVRLAALHALRAGAAHLDGDGGTKALETVTRSLLVEALTGDAPEESTAELRVALRSLLDSDAPVLLEGLEQLATDVERASDETVIEAWRTLAGAGGSRGALAVVAAASEGDANARLAIAGIRDAAVAPQLFAWIDEARQPEGDLDLGGRALAGWLNTGDGEAVDEALSLLARDDRGGELALAGLAHLSDTRSRGTVRLLQSRLEELEDAPGNEVLAARARAALGALDLHASRPLPWCRPAGRARVEMIDGLRLAADRVPRDSEAHSRILYDWLCVATPAELDEIEARVAPESPLAASLARAIEAAR